MVAAAPAAQADDTPPLSLKIYSRCGTSAGTHIAATRDGRGPELRLQVEQRTEKYDSIYNLQCIFRVGFLNVLQYVCVQL